MTSLARFSAQTDQSETGPCIQSGNINLRKIVLAHTNADLGACTVGSAWPFE